MIARNALAMIAVAGIASILATAASAQYTNPTYNNTGLSGDWCENVQINTTPAFNSGTLGEIAGDHRVNTTPTATFVEGSSYVMTLLCNSSWDGQCGAWIDYNGDGDYADANEFLGNSTYASGATTTINFTVPTGITAQAATRFRVIHIYDDTTGPVADPVGTYGFGQTEDWPAVTTTLGGDPEINLQESSTNQPDGSTQNIGSITTGVASTGNFTIQNLGSTNNLNITSITATATGVANCTVSASALSPASPIAAGGSATFTGMVTPITDGPFEFTLVIVNDDVDEGTYTVIYQGNGVSPEISVERPVGVANTIADGGSDPVAGTVSLVPTTLTYTIRNSGTQALTLPATSVSTANASNCTIGTITQPGTSIGIGATASFTIDVTPSAAGGWSFEIDVLSDDSDEANYDIAVSGTAAATPTPQLEVSRTVVIANGGTDNAFGSVVSTPLNLTYTVTNVGSALLTFTGGTPVAVTAGTGTPAIGTITQPGSPTLAAAGGNSTFAVTITPSATAGAWTANVTIASNDPASPYTFTISGTSQAIAAPEIAVVDSSNTDIANGSTYAESATGTVNFNRTFTVQNQGAAALTLTPTATPVVIGGLSNCNVSVTTQPSAGIGPASTSDFVLSITPTAAGGFSFTVTIANDDTTGAENPFVFTYSGNTAAATTGGGSGSGGGCSTGSTGGYSWMALLGLLSALVVFTRIRSSKA